MSCFVLGTDNIEDIQLFVRYDSISAFLYLNFSCVEWIQQVMTFFVGWILDHFDCKQGQVIGYNTRIRQKEFKIIVYLSRCSQNQLIIIVRFNLDYTMLTCTLWSRTSTKDMKVQIIDLAKKQKMIKVWFII